MVFPDYIQDIVTAYLKNLANLEVSGNMSAIVEYVGKLT